MATQPQDKFHLVGHTLDQKFRVERVVTEGGFGILYKGTHLMLDREIALKVLKVPGDYSESARATFIDAFAREAKTIVRISHPNIVQVLDFGVSAMPTGGVSPWMALEWLNGPTLREVLVQRRGKGGQTPQEVLALLRPVLEALGYAHDEGIAHRDIKPANMMLVTTKRGTALKLLDFGIAKAMENGEEAGSGHTATVSTLNAFSLSYAAPEQIGGSRTGPWTDVHAMALIITEMLTDMPPYDGKERTEVCVDALSSRRPTPSKRNIEAGPWEHVLAKALALKPAERFASVTELLQALESTLAAAQAARVSFPMGPPSAPHPAVPAHVTGGYPQQQPAPIAMLPGNTGPSEHSLNPSTLQGVTASGRTAPGGGRLVAIGALVLVGVIALGAAVGLQFRGRNNASPTVPATATSIPVVPPPPPVAPPVQATTENAMAPPPAPSGGNAAPPIAVQQPTTPTNNPPVETTPVETTPTAPSPDAHAHRAHAAAAGASHSTTTTTNTGRSRRTGNAANQNVDID